MRTVYAVLQDILTLTFSVLAISNDPSEDVPTSCTKTTVVRTELQIRGGIEDNSKIFFLISQ